MHTCSTGVPATSSTGTTLSGFCGLATSGPSSPRSISTRSSYSAPSSGAISSKSSSRCWRRSHSRVFSSGGKTAEVAPSSAIMFAIVPRSGTDRSAVPGPVNSNTLFLPPLADQPAQQLEDDVLRLDPGPRELSVEVHLHHRRAGDLVRVAAHRHRHVEPAGADGDHPQRAARGGVRVGAHEDAARLGEALDVHVVADAVARPRVVQAVLAGQRLEHPVVVRVLEVELDDVVVHVLDRPLDLHPRHLELLELHQRHRARGVLEQRLVDAQGDRLTGRQLALDEVLAQDLACEVGAHRGLLF